MRKVNNEKQNFQLNTDEQTTNNVSLDTMRPSDELQVYYNDAYMREKQRFNDMFGFLEEDVPAPDAVKRICIENAQKEMDMSAYISLKKHKKVKSTATVFVLLTLVCAAAAAYFALKFLNIL